MCRGLPGDSRPPRRTFPTALGQTQETGAIAILQRLLRYADKVYGLQALLERGRDGRPRPRIATSTVLGSLLVMALTRLGSLNALEQTQPSSFWRRWLAAPLPSADSLGRIMDRVDPDSLREALHELYAQLKRNKVLPPTSQGLMALAIDGHESHATYRRCCAGCCQRQIQGADGVRSQYYHRHVTAVLLGGQFPLWLDAEPVLPGEGELSAAKRLLKRLLRRHPRAFDVVLGDALYAEAQLFALLHKHGKDLLVVLKANQPDLLHEAQTLLKDVEPEILEHRRARCEVRDLGGFQLGSKFDRPLRVVQSQEVRYVRRQLDGRVETISSQWFWVTTCSEHRASSAAVLRLGHARWDIENQGFNEAVNLWHGDHVYKHSANAMLTFWLLTMLAFNLFQVFRTRQLKPEIRRRTSKLHLARWMASEIYQALPMPEARPP